MDDASLRSRIARLINEWDEDDEYDARVYADRILELMREPTDTMEDAGGDRDRLGYDPAPAAVWRAMIDAAIRGG